MKRQKTKNQKTVEEKITFSLRNSIHLTHLLQKWAFGTYNPLGSWIMAVTDSLILPGEKVPLRL